MRRSVFVYLFLGILALASPLYAVKTTLIDDVIRMSRSGVSDDVIIAFVHRAQDPFTVTADDMIAMAEAKVSKAVIEAVVAEATPAGSTAGATQPAEPPRTSAPPPDASATADSGGWCLTFEPPVFLYPWYPWLYPEWIWDPFWYMPKLDTRSAAAAAAGRVRKPAAPGVSPTPVANTSGSRGSIVQKIIRELTQRADSSPAAKSHDGGSGGSSGSGGSGGRRGGLK